MIEPVWLDERDALAIHHRLLALHGGLAGIRDLTLLQSALARPRQHFAYEEKPELVVMAALYTSGIVRNHPFLDGNKRTGFIVGALFLEINGFQLRASEEDAVEAVLGLARGSIAAGEYAHWLRANLSA